MSRLDLNKRRAGVLVPLSSLRSRQGYGIGDFAALPAFFKWMNQVGLSVWNLLPIGALAPLDSCPYSGISAFALDEAYIDLNNVQELRDSRHLSEELAKAAAKPAVARLRSARRVRFAAVRAFKNLWLERAHSAFARNAPPARRAALEVFRKRHRHWLADYTLYRALSEENAWKSWKRWPQELRDRDPIALAEARKRLAPRLRHHAYVQWQLFDQWRGIRVQAAKYGVHLYGDIPFGLNPRAADIWARQQDFDFTATMGAPPDRYSDKGQAWGLPAYRWEVMEKSGHSWWRHRVRQASWLYDFYRLDHVIGYFRTWLVRRGSARNGFDLLGSKAQEKRGRRFLRMCVEEGHPSRPIAEDLGRIPPYAPNVLKDLRIPGYKIAPWERSGTGFRHPKDYPLLSVATTGTHDTDTLAVWWSKAEEAQRQAYWRMVSGKNQTAPRFSKEVHTALLENIYGARSAFVILPFQDLFGRRERINVPGTVRNSNWTYRIPVPVEDLAPHPKSGLLARLARQTHRA
jgi:4-alpha-glucanotransferase